MESTLNEYQADVVVVGGGLAGLSTAAYLAFKGKKVAVLERATLGGRAVTLNIKGFNFNFGAHAIYGRDTSILRTYEKEMGIQINWNDFNPNKAKYDLGDSVTDVPVNIKGLFLTKILKGADKVKFTFEILKTILGVEKGEPHVSIGQWLENRELDQEVQEMMLTLASSNFFTNEPERIPSEVFFEYYNTLFKTNKPVAYIGGGWQSLINQFVKIIEENGGTIYTKERVESVGISAGVITEVKTKEKVFHAQEFVFCIPPKELVKVFKESALEHILHHYAQYEPSYVFVYDVGLKTRLDVPYTYIYDKQNRLFITDISYYDKTSVPEGGQLLQAIAYLSQKEVGNKEVIEKVQQNIEELYDKHFPGWREELVVPRLSKKAAAQEIKWIMNQEPMPTFFPDFRNAFFAGDWCKGQGQLSELSFSSGYEVAHLILQK